MCFSIKCQFEIHKSYHMACWSDETFQSLLCKHSEFVARSCSIINNQMNFHSARVFIYLGNVIIKVFGKPSCSLMCLRFDVSVYCLL